MVEGKKRTIFAVLNHEAGRGPARLRRLVWDQEIAGSNPAAPTTKAAHICGRFFCAQERTLALQRRISDHGLPNGARPIHCRRTQRTKSLCDGIVHLAVKIVVILSEGQRKLPMVNRLVFHEGQGTRVATQIAPSKGFGCGQTTISSEKCNLLLARTLRETNMVLMVDSEPHR